MLAILMASHSDWRQIIPVEPLYVDKGMDYYASRTFRDYDGSLHDVMSLGWVATWDYAQQQPSQYGKGMWWCLVSWH